MTDTQKLSALNTRLRAAIEAKDKRAILAAYDSAGTLDLERCDDNVFEEYHQLGNEANDILYS